MIKVNGKLSVTKHNLDGTRNVQVDLLADNIHEILAIGNDGSTVVGLSQGDVIDFGSMGMDCAMNMCTMDSTGNWVY